jgi:hypothetical protein
VTAKSERIANFDARGLWDDIYPTVSGVVVAVLWLFIGSKVVAVCEDNKWHLDQIYTAMFGFLAITTGFLATFYGTLQSVSSGFLDKMRGTRTLGSFMSYTRGAIVLGLITSLLSVIMMVAAPLPLQNFTLASFFMSLWMGLIICALCSFYRSARWFFFLLETRIPPNYPGG